jgi:hypothetical protein
MRINFSAITQLYHISYTLVELHYINIINRMLQFDLPS